MARWLPIALLAAVFLGLLGVRVAFLLILRRGETNNPNQARPDNQWPGATVIRTNPETAKRQGDQT